MTAQGRLDSAISAVRGANTPKHGRIASEAYRTIFSNEVNPSEFMLYVIAELLDEKYR